MAYVVKVRTVERTVGGINSRISPTAYVTETRVMHIAELFLDDKVVSSSGEVRGADAALLALRAKVFAGLQDQYNGFLRALKEAHEDISTANRSVG
jgi:hypothetical protein